MNIEEIVNRVYPDIKEYFGNKSTVKLYRNIYHRLDVDEVDEDWISYAEYLWDSDEIVLYTDSIDSEEDVIRSLLHESTHSTQDYDIYKALYEQCNLDYSMHPYEIEAEHEEERWVEYKTQTEYEHH